MVARRRPGAPPGGGGGSREGAGAVCGPADRCGVGRGGEGSPAGSPWCSGPGGRRAQVLRALAEPAGPPASTVHAPGAQPAAPMHRAGLTWHTAPLARPCTCALAATLCPGRNMQRRAGLPLPARPPTPKFSHTPRIEERNVDSAPSLSKAELCGHQRADTSVCWVFCFFSDQA